MRAGGCPGWKSSAQVKGKWICCPVVNTDCESQSCTLGFAPFCPPGSFVSHAGEFIPTKKKIIETQIPALGGFRTLWDFHKMNFCRYELTVLEEASPNHCPGWTEDFSRNNQEQNPGTQPVWISSRCHQPSSCGAGCKQ